MKNLLLTCTLCTVFACQKADLNSYEKSSPDSKESPSMTSASQAGNQTHKDPGPIGGGGGQTPPTPTYLSPTGNQSYTCQYAGIQVNFTNVTYSSSQTPTRSFENYGTYYTTDGYGDATPVYYNVTGGGSGNVFSFNETYCSHFNTTNGICDAYSQRTITGYLVRVLNPQAGAPSFMAIVPPNFFTGTPILPVEKQNRIQ